MDDKKEQVGQIEVSFTYRRHIGPRFEHGSVDLRFNSLQPYSFSSSAKWLNENYEKEIQIGVEKALIEKVGSLQNTRVELLKVDFDEIYSTANGFQSAAYAATCSAFLV